MTEKNIEHLITMLMIFGLFFYLIQLSKIGDKSVGVGSQLSQTAPKKSAWEKISIIASFIGAVAALVYSFVKLYEILK